MGIADCGASHVILPLTVLHDDKSAKAVNLHLEKEPQLKHIVRSMLSM